MINYQDNIKGAFDNLTAGEQESVMEVVALFHIRDGTKNHDGSLGTVKITNREFNDCLAAMLVANRRQ